MMVFGGIQQSAPDFNESLSGITTAFKVFYHRLAKPFVSSERSSARLRVLKNSR